MKHDFNHIVFFDGVCNVCNSSVDFLLKVDRREVLKFASLQGETAKEILDTNQLNDLNTMYYYKDGQLLYKSNAILEICKDMGGGWKLFYVFKIIPGFIRDGLYQLIANNRYKWFGQRETCRMPTPDERDRLLS